MVAVTTGWGLVDDGRVGDRESGGSRPDPEVEPKARRRSFSAAYKLRILAEYEAATSPGAKGAILRRENLTGFNWRDALASACRLPFGERHR